MATQICIDIDCLANILRLLLTSGSIIRHSFKSSKASTGSLNCILTLIFVSKARGLVRSDNVRAAKGIQDHHWSKKFIGVVGLMP